MLQTVLGNEHSHPIPLAHVEKDYRNALGILQKLTNHSQCLKNS